MNAIYVQIMTFFKIIKTSPPVFVKRKKNLIEFKNNQFLQHYREIG